MRPTRPRPSRSELTPRALRAAQQASHVRFAGTDGPICPEESLAVAHLKFCAVASDPDAANPTSAADLLLVDDDFNLIDMVLDTAWLKRSQVRTKAARAAAKAAARARCRYNHLSAQVLLCELSMQWVADARRTVKRVDPLLPHRVRVRMWLHAAARLLCPPAQLRARVAADPAEARWHATSASKPVARLIRMLARDEGQQAAQERYAREEEHAAQLAQTFGQRPPRQNPWRPRCPPSRPSTPLPEPPEPDEAWVSLASVPGRCLLPEGREARTVEATRMHGVRLHMVGQMLDM